MRFFSNEAKDDADEQKDDTAVPQQRSGSPWQHPEPVNPTAGATATPVRPVDDDDPNRTVAFDDGAPRTEPVQVNPAPDAADNAPDAVDNAPDAADKKKDDVDLALDEHDTVDDPHATQPLRTGAGEPLHAADKADSTVVPDEPSDLADEPEPLVTPAPVAESTISGSAPFFPAADTQPLKDRWRDVQLRFVDDPKGATSDASGLVDEAVDKLASALRDHRGSFAKGTDDTEALRVEFRSYRDILDRLLGL